MLQLKIFHHINNQKNLSLNEKKKKKKTTQQPTDANTKNNRNVEITWKEL